MDGEEREARTRGRSLASKLSSLESSQKAKLVSILSSISSMSLSDIAVTVDNTVEDDGGGDDDSAIDFRFSFTCRMGVRLPDSCVLRRKNTSKVC